MVLLRSPVVLSLFSSWAESQHPNLTVSFQKCHRCADSKTQTRKSQRRWKRQVCRLLRDDRRQAARWNMHSTRSTFAPALKLRSSYSAPETSRPDLPIKPGRANRSPLAGRSHRVPSEGLGTVSASGLCAAVIGSCILFFTQL